MINAFWLSDSKAKWAELPCHVEFPEGTLWIDLVRPTEEEIRTVKQTLVIDVPTREAMQEIETTSRLYTDGRAKYMTITMPRVSDQGLPERKEVSFIYLEKILVTLRYDDLRPFRFLSAQFQRGSSLYASAETILLGLLNAIIDQIADILEAVQAELLSLSKEAFASHQGLKGSSQVYFEKILKRIGVQQGLASNAEESLNTLERLIRFLNGPESPKLGKGAQRKLQDIASDAGSLREYISFLSSNVTFLQDATLGMINIDQNNIIKTFSVIAAVFLPPTLIASIYGMNFSYMPELSWPWGYPLALVIMILSAVLPYWLFKRRGLL